MEWVGPIKGHQRVTLRSREGDVVSLEYRSHVIRDTHINVSVRNRTAISYFTFNSLATLLESKKEAGHGGGYCL